MSFLTAWIFLLSISLTIAVRLDGICTNEAECEGPGMLCLAGKCQCNIPWYKPCRSLCELNREFAYEGEKCSVPENCIKYSNCLAGKCVCNQDYAAKNGACFKNLKVPCGNDTECWSEYCFESRCTCRPGYESSDGTNTCQRKLVNVYTNSNDANISNAFCIDQSSCLEIIAECRIDSGQPTMKFCQCPIGYQIVENKRCDAIKSGQLSPLDPNPPNYGPCGVCEDENAVCTTAANERTCWCRSGYVKSGNTCVQGTKSMMIFPNSVDLAINNFTNDCSDEFNQIEDIKNKFCICAKGYEFVNKNRPCRKIDRQWINDVYEYGLCTRINSRDEATGEDSLCPEPLKCEAKIDKHVCSCGKDQFRDLDDPSQCVYYIGKQVNSTNGTCPKSAKQNDTTGICECLMGYKAIMGNRQCELILSAEPFQPSCNQNRSIDDECRKKFGSKTFLCTIGECRCNGAESFADKEKTGCYSPVNQLLMQPEKICPPYSTLLVNRCVCNDGYRASSDSRQCVRLVVSLIEYRGPSRNTNGGLTLADCKALGFMGPVEVYDTGYCQCRNESFRNEDGNGCWYRFDFTIPVRGDYIFCPPNTTRTDPTCQCGIGFERKGDTCVPRTDRVYIDQEAAARNISGITSAICVLFFGHGAIKSTHGDYCICLSDAYPVRSNTYCHFLINVTTPESKDSRSCPANTNVSYSGTYSVCLCKPGYNISPNNQNCEPTNIPLIGAEKKEITNCVIFSNDHCIVKYGEAAFCQNETCFCDRALSYVNADKKCESFSNFVFPGEQELAFYSCDTDKDCAGKDKVICDYLNEQSGYKVCKCQDGSYLDPKTETCVENRCINCDETQNFECRDFQCRCKNGYYLNDSKCVEYATKLQLYQQCDPNIFPDMNTIDSLVCDRACNRTQCSLGSRPQDSQCAQYQLANDKCVHQESICQTIDGNSICDRDRNQCLCGPSYYQFKNTCARAVGSVCKNDDDCGAEMDCKGKRCTCNPKQYAEQINDIYGRPIHRCVNNGIDQLRFYPVLVLFFLLTRVFLI